MKTAQTAQTDVRDSIICLGGGIESLEIIKQVYQHGFCPVVMDTNNFSPGILWAKKQGEGHARYLQANVYNISSVYRKLQIHLKYSPRRSNYAGIMCCAIDAPHVQAKVAEYLELSTIGKQQAELSHNKWKQYEWLQTRNFPVPQSRLLGIDSTPEDIVGYDLLKPMVGRGAKGVAKITSDDYRKQLFRSMAESEDGYKKVIAQKWLDGLQLSTESYIRDGEMMFTAVALRNYDKLDEYHPYVIENGSDSPFHMEPRFYKRLCDLILRACIAMDWTNTTVKGDIIFDRDVFYIVELSPRLSGGFFCTHIIPLAYGYDMVASALNVATGMDLPQTYYGKEQQFVCQRFVFPRPEWIGEMIIKSPSVDLKCMEMDGVQLATMYYTEGRTVKPITSHNCRLGQVIAVGKTEAIARTRAEQAVDYLWNGIRMTEDG